MGLSDAADAAAAAAAAQDSEKGGEPKGNCWSNVGCFQQIH
jgi:hypothetical protein